MKLHTRVEQRVQGEWREIVDGYGLLDGAPVALITMLTGAFQRHPQFGHGYARPEIQFTPLDRPRGIPEDVSDDLLNGDAVVHRLYLWDTYAQRAHASYATLAELVNYCWDRRIYEHDPGYEVALLQEVSVGGRRVFASTALSPGDDLGTSYWDLVGHVMGPALAWLRGRIPSTGTAADIRVIFFVGA